MTVPAAAAVSAGPAARDPDRMAVLHRLRDLDLTLARVALRLTTGNAALCRDIMPVSGLSLHARNQYPDSMAGPVTAVFGFAEPLAVSAVVPGSPADQAGIRPNDGIISAAGRVPAQADTDGRPDTLVRDGFEAELANHPPAAPMAWQVRRAGQVLHLVVTPQPGCRVRFEVVPGEARIARNDGQLIQIGARYVDELGEAALAAMVAHELAHSVLLHRERLVAAGVSKGLLAGFGRNGRLNRRVEREADRLSVYLLHNAGYDPLVAARFWEEPEGRRGGGLLRERTHDSAAARARLIRAEIDRLGAARERASGPIVPDWLDERLQPLS